MNTVRVKDNKRINGEYFFVTRLRGIEKAAIKIVARDFYNLFVNGEFVNFGPARTAHGHLRVDEINLSPYLNGINDVIAVDLVYYDTISLSFTREYMVFGAEIRSGDGGIVADTSDFKCYEASDRVERVERYSSQRGFAEFYKQFKDRSFFYKGDFSLFSEVETEAVKCPSLLKRRVPFNKNEILGAEKIKIGGLAKIKGEEFVNDLIREIDSKKLISYSRDECEVCLSRIFVDFKNDDLATYGRYELYKFDYDRSGKVVIKLEVSGNDAEIYCSYDEILTDGDVKFNRESIIQGFGWNLKRGVYSLTTFEPYCLQYLKLHIIGEVKVSFVGMIVVQNPLTENFGAECADKTLESIIYAAKHSFEQNSSDLYTDCPSRERSGWLCDSYFMAIAESVLTGGNLIEKVFLENYCLFDKMKNLPPKVLPMCYPSESKSGNYIPNWALWFIIEIFDYTRRTNDGALVEISHKRILDVLDFFSKYENESELLEDLDGWVFVEWSKANDFTGGVNFPTNMLYAAALNAAGIMFNDYSLIAKSRRLKSEIRRLSYNGKFFADNAVRQNKKLVVQSNYTETCQYYAIFFGIADDRLDKYFYNTIVDNFGINRVENVSAYPDIYPSNMFIGYYLRLLILSRVGRCDELIAECKTMFSLMAEKTSTLWENMIFSNGEGPGLRGSCNHGFTAIVAAFLIEALVGYKGFDTTKKQIYFKRVPLKFDCRFTLPVGDKILVVKSESGKLDCTLPQGYSIEEVQ